VTTELLLWALLAIPSLGVLGLTLFNEVLWPRGRADGEFDGEISVLIPCRNEQASIESCIRAIFESTRPVEEVVVFDDGSTDSTPEILETLTEEFERLRVEKGDGLPEGWVGKPHACHQLARRASADADLLFYIDADVDLDPEGVARIGSILEDFDADVITSVPRQRTETFFERLVLPVLHLTYTSWLPLPLIWRTRDPRFLAANGQILAVRRTTYDKIGGFESVKNEVVDDMAFCRRVKEAKDRVVFADGHHIAACRMYEDTRGVWEGFSKNIYEGIGAHPLALLVVLGLYIGTFLVPFVGFAAGLIMGHQTLMLASAVAISAQLMTRFVLAVRHSQPVEGILLHPLSIVAFCAIAINSMVWNLKGEISWAGRTYAAKSAR